MENQDIMDRQERMHHLATSHRRTGATIVQKGQPVHQEDRALKDSRVGQAHQVKMVRRHTMLMRLPVRPDHQGRQDCLVLQVLKDLVVHLEKCVMYFCLLVHQDLLVRKVCLDLTACEVHMVELVQWDHQDTLENQAQMGQVEMTVLLVPWGLLVLRGLSEIAVIVLFQERLLDIDEHSHAGRKNTFFFVRNFLKFGVFCSLPTHF